MKTKMEHFPATNPNPVLSVAKNGTVLYSNEAGKPLLREWGIAVREKLPSDIEDIVQEVISQNSPEKMEVKAGNKIYFVSFHPLPEEECVNIYGFDISDLKEIEEKLRESEEKYRDIIETAIEGIWILDAEFRTSYVNKKMAEILRYNQEEMIDRFPWDFADEEGKNIIKLNMEKRLQVISEILEIKYIRSDGSPLWAQVSSKSLFDENGKFTGVLGMLTDITERKQAADELRLSEANLARAQSITHLGNWFWDVKYDRIVGSLEFLRMLCFEHLDCIAYSDFIARVHPEDREPVNIAVQAALFDKMPYSIDYRILLSEGVERFIHAEGEVTRNKTGHPVTMFGTVQDITEQKQGEKALRENEARLRLSLDSSDAGMWEWDLGTNRNVWSEEIWRLYGLQPHCCEPSYEVWRDTIHSDDREMAERTVQEAAMDGAEINFEYRMQEDGGKVRWLMSRGRPLVDSAGKSVRYIGIVVDITERKKVEEALSEAYEKLQIQSEKLQVSNEELRVQSDELNEANALLHDRVTGFRTLAENSPDLIARFDRQGRCLYTNPSCEEFNDTPKLIHFYGLSINDLIKKPDYVIQIDPEMMKLSEKQRKNAITTGKSETTVFHYVSPKGKKYWFDTKVIPEFVNNEVVSVLIISRDITVMKEAEVRLKETLGNLEEKVTERTSELEEAYKLSLENERRFNEAQKMAHIGSWDRNIVTGELYWSDETYRIYGRKPQEFGATYNAFLSYVHPDDRDNVDNAVKEAINGKPYDIDYRIILNNGEERIVHAQGGSIFDERKTPIRLRGTVQDITEQKKAEEALAKIEVVRKQEIHHRIKNNLQVISSLLDLQAETFNKREDIKDSEVLKAFRESQDRVISMALIHEELYKGGGLEKLNFSPYIEKLTNSLFLTYRLGNTDVSLNIDLEENLFFDMDIAVPLGIIVNELVSNSLKHAFTGKDIGEIRIRLHREEGNDACFILNISDNGVGIPEDIDIEHLESLGLQLVTTLVDQLDGELEMKRDNGTEFTVRFTVTEKNNQASVPAQQ